MGFKILLVVVTGKWWWREGGRENLAGGVERELGIAIAEGGNATGICIFWRRKRHVGPCGGGGSEEGEEGVDEPDGRDGVQRAGT